MRNIFYGILAVGLLLFSSYNIYANTTTDCKPFVHIQPVKGNYIPLLNGDIENLEKFLLELAEQNTNYCKASLRIDFKKGLETKQTITRGESRYNEKLFLEVQYFSPSYEAVIENEKGDILHKIELGKELKYIEYSNDKLNNHEALYSEWRLVSKGNLSKVETDANNFQALIDFLKIENGISVPVRKSLIVSEKKDVLTSKGEIAKVEKKEKSTRKSRRQAKKKSKSKDEKSKAESSTKVVREESKEEAKGKAQSAKKESTLKVERSKSSTKVAQEESKEEAKDKVQSAKKESISKVEKAKSSTKIAQKETKEEAKDKVQSAKKESISKVEKAKSSTKVVQEESKEEIKGKAQSAKENTSKVEKAKSSTKVVQEESKEEIKGKVQSAKKESTSKVEKAKSSTKVAQKESKEKVAPKKESSSEMDKYSPPTTSTEVAEVNKNQPQESTEPREVISDDEMFASVGVEEPLAEMVRFQFPYGKNYTIINESDFSIKINTGRESGKVFADNSIKPKEEKNVKNKFKNGDWYSIVYPEKLQKKDVENYKKSIESILSDLDLSDHEEDFFKMSEQLIPNLDIISSENPLADTSQEGKVEVRFQKFMDEKGIEISAGNKQKGGATELKKLLTLIVQSHRLHHYYKYTVGASAAKRPVNKLPRFRKN